jgi:transcriptional regulator with XRE-family HTH domain
MLEVEPFEETVSSGFPELDAVLGGLFWGDNVVWDLDGASAEPFYRAIGGVDGVFEMRAVVSLGAADSLGLDVLDAGPASALADPAKLLREIHRLCHPPGRRLFLFESLDSMARAWGVVSTREFFVRCCPMLLEAEAIAYWSMSAGATSAHVRNAVEAVTQCVLHVDGRSVRVAKAEGRDDDATGSVLHWHDDGGRVVLEPAATVDRLPAALQAVRRLHHLSQHDLADLAGVTASAISQAERAERGLSLATLLRLSAALGITIDAVLRGEESDAYRIGRRGADPRRGPAHTTMLLADAGSNLRVDLVHLGARQAGAPSHVAKGSAVLAVASGLVQVQVGGQMPAVRHGEVLVADSDRVEGWRNLRDTEATLFWIVASA